MINQKLKLITTYLDELLPNASCELNYTKDYELLLAVMFSAQTTDKKVNMELEKQYQQEQLIYMITSSVIPLLIVLVLGCFALVVLKGFVSKIPTPKKTERKVVEELIPKVIEEEEAPEISPRIEFNKKEIQSQKEQTISEINEAVLAAPEDAAKLLTSFIRE